MKNKQIVTHTLPSSEDCSEAIQRVCVWKGLGGAEECGLGGRRAGVPILMLPLIGYFFFPSLISFPVVGQAFLFRKYVYLLSKTDGFIKKKFTPFHTPLSPPRKLQGFFPLK